MRKLLVLLLVLGMASVASAALTIDVNGQTNPGVITLMPSDYVWISISSNMGGALKDMYKATLTLTDPVSGAYSALAAWTGNINVYIPPAIPEAYGMLIAPYAAYAVNAFARVTGIMPAAGTGFEFELHCEGIGDVLVQLTDLRDASIADTLLIHQIIPEPMTMVLLGLGGLSLIRRRR